MKRLIIGVLALVSALSAVPAQAQVIIDAPRGLAIPAQGIAFGTKDGAATFVDATHGLPIRDTPSSNNIVSFQQTCTTSAIVLAANSYSNGFVVKALIGNTGTVYIGGAGVTTGTGYPLLAGEPISYGAANSNQSYIICSNATDKVAVTGN